jgi:hypothetical protein
MVLYILIFDRLCVLVVRVPDYTSKGPIFDSRRYQIFWEVVGLERGQLNLVSTTENLLERKNSGSGLESREYGRGDPLCWQRITLYPQKLALTSSTSGSRSVGMVRSRTKVTSLLLFVIFYFLHFLTAGEKTEDSGLTIVMSNVLSIHVLLWYPSLFCNL